MGTKAMILATVVTVAAMVLGCGGGIKVEPGDGETDTAVDTGGDGDAGDVPEDTVVDTPEDGTDTGTDTGVDPEPDGPVTDTDGDTISDAHEGDGDTDGDGVPDREDLDSDGDGVDDADEAGDDDLGTPPEDCESDGLPSFQDLDSDDDGLSDEQEAAHGTDPCLADSDGDGTSDLGEIAYGSDPLDDTDSPTAVGDFVFEMPLDETPRPAVDTLVFSTNLKVADVYFLIELTGSLSAEIGTIVSGLNTVIIPGILAEISDAWFGVGAYQDCDSSWCDYGMAMVQPMTDDTAVVVDTLTDISSDWCGGSEPYRHAIYATATGDVAAFSSWAGVSPTTWSCPTGAFGWPCFRPEAVPIIIHLGDEDFDTASSSCPAPSITHTQAVDALNGIEARYIGLNAGDLSWENSHDDMVAIAEDTGSVDTTGAPLVYDVSGDISGLSTQIVDAVSAVATAVPIRVDAIAEDDPADMVDAVGEFVERVNTNTSGSSIWDPILGEMRECTPAPTGTPGLEPPTLDHFSVVEPGQSVCFDIVPKVNTTIPATTIPLVFRAVIHVLGDEHTPLDDREIYFIVPPDITSG